MLDKGVLVLHSQAKRHPAYDLDITFLHMKCFIVTLSAES